MTDFLQIECARKGPRLLSPRYSRIIGPVDSKAFIRFVDVFREHGADAAMPLFPMEWEWCGNKRDVARPVLDLVPISASGIVLTDRAYQAVGALFPTSTPHVQLELDGDIYHWLRVPILDAKVEEVPRVVLVEIPVDQIPASTPFVVLVPGAIHVCRRHFAEAWQAAGLTGAVFTPINL